MRPTVLICDDEYHILESVSYIVRNAGFEAISATDGAEALRLARLERPKVMILDVMMPRLTGFEVCRKLKGDPATRDIHLILLTARGQEKDEQQGRDCGADEYMTKPFSPRRLRQRLVELLSGGEADNDARAFES
jgi:two-component system alkaline phosphatase synthesis response regulator PhoP